MKIPAELLAKWNDLKSHGDGKRICEANPKLNRMDVSRAINNGECSDEVFEAIAGFYKEKESKIKVYL